MEYFVIKIHDNNDKKCKTRQNTYSDFNKLIVRAAKGRKTNEFQNNCSEDRQHIHGWCHSTSSSNHSATSTAKM